MKSVRKQVLIMLAIVAAGISLVVTLAWDAIRPLNEKNSFLRTFIPSKLSVINAINKPKDVGDFAGTTNTRIYFKTTEADKLLISDKDLQNGNELKLNIHNIKELSGFNCIVDSPYITITAGNIPAVITVCRDSASFSKFPNGLFSKAIRISPSSLVVRMFDKMDQIFVKGNPGTNELLREHNVSEKNNDAGISTDGLLHFDKTTGFITYVYYYRNQFICLDTNLNVVYRGHTIDTVVTSKTQVKLSEMNNVMTNNAPNHVTNGRSTVSNGYLFVNSKLKSDNEPKDSFSENSVIDIYRLSDGDYRGSFYIPFYKGERMKKFKIINDRLVVIYSSHIVSFLFQPKL
jgi:hypothetical protein